MGGLRGGLLGVFLSISINPLKVIGLSLTKGKALSQQK